MVMLHYKLIKINPDDNHLLIANHRVIVITNSTISSNADCLSGLLLRLFNVVHYLFFTQ